MLGKLGSTTNEREAFVKEQAIGYLVATLQPGVPHPSWRPGAGLPARWTAAWWHGRWVASAVLGAFASSAHIIPRLGVVFSVSLLDFLPSQRVREQAKKPRWP